MGRSCRFSVFLNLKNGPKTSQIWVKHTKSLHHQKMGLPGYPLPSIPRKGYTDIPGITSQGTPSGGRNSIDAMPALKNACDCIISYIYIYICMLIFENMENIDSYRIYSFKIVNPDIFRKMYVERPFKVPNLWKQYK